MESLSLVELKQVAKTRRIKHYYVMKRAQLIELLSKNELPREMVLEKKTIVELRQEAKDRNLHGFWRLTRAEILGLLYPDTEKDQQHKGDANQHDKPKSHDAKDVGVEVPEDPLEDGA